MWFWLSVTAGFASAIEKVVNRVTLKNKGNIVAFATIYFSIITLISFPLSLPIDIVIIPELIILLIVQAIFWSLGSLFSFWAQTNTDVSLSQIVSRARIIWMIPLGFIFLNQRPSIFSMIGMGIIFVGLATLFFRENIHKYRGIQSMVLGSIFVACGSVINAVLVINFLSPAQVTFVTMLGQACVFLVILIVRKNAFKRMKEIFSRAWYLIVLAAVIETYAFIGINLAFKTGLASAVTSIYLGMTIATVWIGIILLKEKQHLWRKAISSAIVTAGIIIVKLFT